MQMQLKQKLKKIKEEGCFDRTKNGSVCKKTTQNKHKAKCEVTMTLNYFSIKKTLQNKKTKMVSKNYITALDDHQFF